ncbi:MULTISPECIES: hypothetical protein [Streptomyces]|uniref:Uncharacterized protein n=2 Tax=Streptomyces TaxID=1883 RepID=A0ABV9J602_9ACTN
MCELDGARVAEQDVGRAYERASGALVPVTDDDLDRLPLPTAHTIELPGTVPADGIDPRRPGAYYLPAQDSPTGAAPTSCWPRAWPGAARPSPSNSPYAATASASACCGPRATP